MDTTTLSYSVPGYRKPHHRRAMIRALTIIGAVLFSLLLGGIVGWGLHASTVAPPESVTVPSATPSVAPSTGAGGGVVSPAATVPAVAP